MDNYAIADQFSVLAKLMEIHGENSFKAKSYASAAFNIEKFSSPLSGLSSAEIIKIKGIGDSAGKKVIEIIETGELKALQNLIDQTPPGVLEMMQIKGLGPKKINIIWKQLDIDTIEDLELACKENRVAVVKGFGEKTAQKILDSIEFAKEKKGQYLYKQAEDFATLMQERLQSEFPKDDIQITGAFRMQMEVISQLEWVVTVGREALKDFVLTESATIIKDTVDELVVSAADLMQLHFYFATKETFAHTLFYTSCSKPFAAAFSEKDFKGTTTEEAIFKNAGYPYLPPYLRENIEVLKKDTAWLNDIIKISNIKGLIHSHSNWSDGANTIEEMAEELVRLGFEYLVISDHSKAAFYANGLQEQRILEQHRYIDELNKKLHPFKIFKSIECDILNDGTLDYSNDVLSTFDLVITSIHSNLQMSEEKAMQRLLGAINNPYTTILGHMTGRLLLKRNGYPVDHKKIIDACAKNNVVIEINASPRRLDIDWRWIDYALEKNVMLSINPDAHSLEEFLYVKYGTLVAQKGGLPASKNLSSFSLEEFEQYLRDTKKIKGLVA